MDVSPNPISRGRAELAVDFGRDRSTRGGMSSTSHILMGDDENKAPVKRGDQRGLKNPESGNSGGDLNGTTTTSFQLSLTTFTLQPQNRRLEPNLQVQRLRTDVA